MKHIVHAHAESSTKASIRAASIRREQEFSSSFKKKNRKKRHYAAKFLSPKIKAAIEKFGDDAEAIPSLTHQTPTGRTVRADHRSNISRFLIAYISTLQFDSMECRGYGRGKNWRPTIAWIAKKAGLTFVTADRIHQECRAAGLYESVVKTKQVAKGVYISATITKISTNFLYQLGLTPKEIKGTIEAAKNTISKKNATECAHAIIKSAAAACTAAGKAFTSNLERRAAKLAEKARLKAQDTTSVFE